MNTFECRIDIGLGEEVKYNVIDFTPSKARYQFYKSHLSDWYDYKDVFKGIRIRSLGKVKPEYFFGDKESFQRMTKHRNIEFAYQGMKIDVDGKVGYIVGNCGMNLDVLFDGYLSPSNCHPHWKTTYYHDGEIIKAF